MSGGIPPSSIVIASLPPLPLLVIVVPAAPLPAPTAGAPLPAPGIAVVPAALEPAVITLLPALPIALLPASMPLLGRSLGSSLVLVQPDSAHNNASKPAPMLRSI